MARLTILLPELRRLAASPLPGRWLARGDRLADVKPGRNAALRGCFEFLGSAVPAAALLRSLEAGDAAGTLWVRADPCYVVVDATAVRMLAWGNLALTAEQGSELARALRPLFGDAGFPLEPAAPEHWYLRCPGGVRLPTFADPHDVLGADLLPHFPHGDNERQWRHLLNEAQVILHNHPVNIARAQRGQVPANSVWFWGAGQLPEWVRTPFTRAVSSDPLLGALARRAGIAVESLPGAAELRVDANDALLLDLAHSGAPDGAWFEAVGALLAARRVAALELRFESGEAVVYKSRHRWRFWRRPVVPAA